LSENAGSGSVLNQSGSTTLQIGKLSGRLLRFPAKPARQLYEWVASQLNNLRHDTLFSKADWSTTALIYLF
jgi:lysozyme family protein